MVYEEITIKSKDSLAQIASDYGYSTSDWAKIWNDYENSHLKNRREKPEHLMAGDKIQVPIPWKITSRIMAPAIARNGVHSFKIDVKRNGAKGKNLKWVQTVFEDNQPINLAATYGGGYYNYCVDAPDDDEPFYYTSKEIRETSSYRNNFGDLPSRFSPHDRTTTWRAVLSLSTVFEKRVSIIESIVWGVDFGKNGTNMMYLPRHANEHEIMGHIHLLNTGKGLSQRTFKSDGWTFRKAPKH